MTTREPLVPHDPTATVAAGGIAPLEAKLTSDERTTPVAARSYTHRDLPGKTIVRLEPDAIAAGADAEMVAYGFGEATVSPPLGQVRFRTLGFPAWALVHEPKNAKIALDVTDDMRQAKRLVLAKPGHARDAFEKIAKTLQRGAPQFLPSFWEECGRVIAEHASASMAAQCFEKARAAERAFKLKADGEATDAVFVEFALLGALAVKSLSAYAKELVKAAGGKEAYRRFRKIIVKRALGGMAPYSGMMKDIASLVKDAKLGEEAELDALLAELIEAPGVAKAPIEFWTTARPALLRLGAPLQPRLRAIWPDPKGGSDDARQEFRLTWLEILRETGALAKVPDDGLGAWMSRMIEYAGNVPPVVAMMRELAPRLAKQPIAVVSSSRWNETLELDLAELALSLGIPLVDPGEDASFDPDAMTCDPVLVAAHPVYGKQLVESVSGMFGDDKHEKTMRGKAGFLAARRAWLVSELGDLTKHALYAANATIELLEQKTSAQTFAQFPDLYAQLAATDLAVALAHQIAVGNIDELAWPAYEAARAKLGGEIVVDGAFPILTLANATKALALDRTGVIAEHDLVYKPKEEKPKQVMYFDGQFLVLLDSKKGSDCGYWSEKPKDRFETYLHYAQWSGDLPSQWTTPAGAVTLGDKAFRAGDHEPTNGSRFAVDGAQMYQLSYSGAKSFDPDKGTKGATGQVPFFAAWPKIELNSSTYFPVAAPSSLLGVRDGVWAVRTRSVDKRHETQRSVDTAPISTMAEADALVDFPGLAAPMPLNTVRSNNAKFSGGDGHGVGTWAPTHYIAQLNQDDWAQRGWGAAAVPPLQAWHYLVAREPKASIALRAVTAEIARPIFGAAKRDVAASEETGRTMTHAEAAVKKALPVTDAVLVRGLAGLAEKAAELEVRLRALVDATNPANAGDPKLNPRAAKVHRVAKAIEAGKAATIPDFDIDLREWFGRGRMAAVLGPTANEDAKERAIDVANGLAGTLLADDVSKLRIFDLETPDDYDDGTEYETVLVVNEGASTYLVDPGQNYVLEYARDGKFRAPPKPWLVGDNDKRGLQRSGSDWLRGFVAIAESPPAWTPAIPARLAETSGLTIAEATLLSIALEGVSRYGKDYFGKKVREQLGGLKIADADAARTTFAKIEPDEIYALMSDAISDDPAALRDPLASGGYIDRLGAAWKAKYGKRQKLSAELVSAAKSDLDLRNLDDLLPPFLGDLSAWFLKPDRQKLDERGNEDSGLDVSKANELALLVCWLSFARPVGDPARDGVPAIVAKIREILADPDVLWEFGTFRFHGNDKRKAQAASLLDMVSTKKLDLTKPNPACTVSEDKNARDVSDARDDGAIVIAKTDYYLNAGFRTAKLASARKKIEQLAKLMNDEEDDDEDAVHHLVFVAFLQSDDFAAIAERIATTPVPAGGFEANPLLSTPKLVAKVAKAQGISSEAAALYLQTLALAEPTQRDVIAWNGWTTKIYAAAAAELVKKKLVIEGKRDRAGRTIFVKGGYTKGRDKDLPMEEWKEPLYLHLDRHVPTEPVHQLFARAWKRVEDGDGPK